VAVQKRLRGARGRCLRYTACHVRTVACRSENGLFAVDTLVKHFASALGERGVRVNAVAPGVVETDMSNFARTDSGRNVTLAMQALKRVAQPDDIAPVVAFLASDQARWITGDTVRVDGGSKL